MSLPPSRRNLLLIVGGSFIIIATIVSVSWQHLPELTGQAMMSDDNSYMEMPDDGDDSTSCTSYDDCPESILPSGCEEGGDKREGTAWHCDDATNTCVSTPFPCSDSSESSETSESSQGSCPSGSRMVTTDTANDTDDKCVVNGGECGNGIVEEGEKCDDGKHCWSAELFTNPPGTFTSCKNKEKDCNENEICIQMNNDGCNNKCKIENYCLPKYGLCNSKDHLYSSEEYVDFFSGEECMQNCYQCGNGTIEGDEECDDGGLCENDSTSPCTSSEDCKTEKYSYMCVTHNNDGCDTSCKIEPFCGDGNVDEGEECDDGIRECVDSNGGGFDCEDDSECENVGDEKCLPRSGDGCTAECKNEGCCLPNGECTTLGEEECLESEGDYWEDGEDCLTYCMTPSMKGCCLPNGNCIEMLKKDCTDAGGFSYPNMKGCNNLCPKPPKNICCICQYQEHAAACSLGRDTQEKCETDQCENGMDDDGDGYVDANDPECDDTNDNSESEAGNQWFDCAWNGNYCVNRHLLACEEWINASSQEDCDWHAMVPDGTVPLPWPTSCTERRFERKGHTLCEEDVKTYVNACLSESDLCSLISINDIGCDTYEEYEDWETFYENLFVPPGCMMQCSGNMAVASLSCPSTVTYTINASIVETDFFICPIEGSYCCSQMESSVPCTNTAQQISDSICCNGAGAYDFDTFRGENPGWVHGTECPEEA